MKPLTEHFSFPILGFNQMLSLLSKQLARILLREKGNRTTSQIAGNGLSLLSRGLISPGAGTHIFHAALVGAAALTAAGWLAQRKN